MSLNRTHIKSGTLMLDDSAPCTARGEGVHAWVASEFPVLRATWTDMSQLQQPLGVNRFAFLRCVIQTDSLEFVRV